MSKVSTADVAIVIATLMGPLFAVQVQVWLERMRARRYRREQVFFALMRTRASSLVPEHVHALNAVPIEFYGKKDITAAYKDYIAHVNLPQTDPTAWGARRVDLFMDLLHKIATELRYKFTVAQLKGEFYAPRWQFDLEGEQVAIRQGILKIIQGEAALPMDVKSFPADPEAQAAMKAVLKGEAPLAVKQISPK